MCTVHILFNTGVWNTKYMRESAPSCRIAEGKCILKLDVRSKNIYMLKHCKNVECAWTCKVFLCSLVGAVKRRSEHERCKSCSSFSCTKYLRQCFHQNHLISAEDWSEIDFMWYPHWQWIVNGQEGEGRSYSTAYPSSSLTLSSPSSFKSTEDWCKIYVILIRQ